MEIEEVFFFNLTKEKTSALCYRGSQKIQFSCKLD